MTRKMKPEKVPLGQDLAGGKAELDLQELITGRTLLCSITLCQLCNKWTLHQPDKGGVPPVPRGKQVTLPQA